MKTKSYRPSIAKQRRRMFLETALMRRKTPHVIKDSSEPWASTNINSLEAAIAVADSVERLALEWGPNENRS
ncbi:MAG: hypothetical protein JO263_01575 [Candidatus Eremiobacteraeota bacterium]|nr:hypothetical protein [Candidatus Eremiobacteraeota bacterium]